MIRFLNDELLVKECHVGLLAEQIIEVREVLDGLCNEREASRAALARIFY